MRAHENFIAFDDRLFLVCCAQMGLDSETERARALGLSRGVLYAVRRGFVPDPEVQARIAQVLGTRPDLLWRSIPRTPGDNAPSIEGR
jgi:hypothetical protein